MADSFVLRGNIIFSPEPGALRCLPRGFLVCADGRVEGAFEKLPERFEILRRVDYGDHLIIPGLCDLHTHAPQHAFCGLGMNLELVDWLNAQAFPEEARYADLDYARSAYALFVDALKRGATTRAVIFGTIHVPATLLLMDMLEHSGLRCYVGKVNTDRNSPDNLREASALQSLEDTKRWLAACVRYQRVRPILTPRFVPSCTDELMAYLGALRGERGLALQSHLDENRGEIDWVRALCPDLDTYAAVYDHYGMLGGAPSVMAHCVYMTPSEEALIRERGTFVAHCPGSNTNLSSGIAPTRRYLRAGLSMGLGTDVAGGHSLSVFRAVADAVQMSKLYWRLVDERCAPLSLAEAFYLATKGGGAFFGKVGSFETGYELDAVVIDDGALRLPYPLTLEERLERAVYMHRYTAIIQKYVSGEAILPPDGEDRE